MRPLQLASACLCSREKIAKEGNSSLLQREGRRDFVSIPYNDALTGKYLTDSDTRTHTHTDSLTIITEVSV